MDITINIMSKATNYDKWNIFQNITDEDAHEIAEKMDTSMRTFTQVKLAGVIDEQIDEKIGKWTKASGYPGTMDKDDLKVFRIAAMGYLKTLKNEDSSGFREEIENACIDKKIKSIIDWLDTVD